MLRKQIAAANWKMNLTLEHAQQLLNDINSENIEINQNQLVVFAVPFPYLSKAADAISGKNGYHVAAQNCSDKLNGAYTGEVSVEMLSSMGIKYCVVGHSERREYYNETDKVVGAKVDLCLDYGITPIFCCGEPIQVRDKNEQNSYVEEQLKAALFHLNDDHIGQVVIAYEPIWAIGTGKTATTEQAQEMHRHIRDLLAAKFGAEKADSISILYGGSVKSSNAAEIFASPDVDGGLVGGASLKAQEFCTIIKSLKK